MSTDKTLIESLQISKLNKQPYSKNETVDECGKVRIMSFNFDTKDFEDKEINNAEYKLANMPSGRIKILSIALDYIKLSSNHDVSFHYEHYDNNGDFYTSAQDAILYTSIGDNLEGSKHTFIINEVFYSIGGFTLFMHTSNFDASDELSGYILYVAD